MGIHTINVPSTHRHVNSLMHDLEGFSLSLIEWALIISDGSCMSCCLYTHRVIQKQKDKDKVEENGDEEDEEGIEVDEDDL